MELHLDTHEEAASQGHLDTHEEAASQGPDRELHAALSQSLRKNQDAPAATAAAEKM